jgi:hypothetical protein
MKLNKYKCSTKSIKIFVQYIRTHFFFFFVKYNLYQANSYNCVKLKSLRILDIIIHLNFDHLFTPISNNVYYLIKS